MKKIHLICFFLMFSTVSAAAQNKIRQIIQEQKKIENYFQKTIPWKFAVDSTIFYAFAFKVTVSKAGEKINIDSITANDSVAYEMYPGYDKFFRSINYGLFMAERKHVSFILPVAINVFDSTRGGWGKGIDPTKNYLALFSYQPTDFRDIENYIYFKPFVSTFN